MPRSCAIFRALALLAACALVGGGCTALPEGRHTPTPAPAVDRAALQAAAVASYLETMQRLAQSGAAEQAEIFAAAKRQYDEAPTPSNQLRYALAVATPGHAAGDLALAQTLLRELQAAPEALLPAERALAFLELQRVDRLLQLTTEIKRLQAEADRAERERTASASRRLQSEIEDNARLRKALDEAQAKLDAIANIERTITERRTPNQGRSN
ncbi:MAG TPA: hypothetical protein VF315_05720 [Steroidobacteraceae bacterium]